jgi:hypothetical protein
MKNQFFFFVLTLMCTFLSAENQTAPTQTNSTAKKAVDDATYWLIISNEPRELVKQFDSNTDDKQLVVKAITKVRRDSYFGVAILLSRCKANPKTGKCDLIVTYRIYSPDGSLDVERSELVLWASPPPQKFDLGMSVWVTRPEESDPPGNYLLTAEIIDRVSKRTINLQQPFEQQP